MFNAGLWEAVGEGDGGVCGASFSLEISFHLLKDEGGRTSTFKDNTNKGFLSATLHSGTPAKYVNV